MATTEPRSTLRSGQQVRITACPQHNPDHLGQVGIVARTNKRTPIVSVYVGIGICQARAVEPVTEDVVRVEGAPSWWPVCVPLPGS
jgi:hypothetical protein